MSLLDWLFPPRTSLADLHRHWEREDELANERLRIWLEHQRETERLNNEQWQTVTTRMPKDGDAT